MLGMLPHIRVRIGGTMKTFPNPPASTKTRNSAIELTAAELQDRIRERAYELYEQHGREDGHDCDHWLQAEAEITSHRTKSRAA